MPLSLRLLNWLTINVLSLPVLELHGLTLQFLLASDVSVLLKAVCLPSVNEQVEQFSFFLPLTLGEHHLFLVMF
ncbi:unnamed protein product [Schistosoma curassoni]|uniref:Secreted protein n=1 Tax=Schistosoma curassoni TaxID=6186 RepID=A0A183JDJ1_9TREM|nr:unnamed protein product [Schistosoma curassoni]